MNKFVLFCVNFAVCNITYYTFDLKAPIMALKDTIFYRKNTI